MILYMAVLFDVLVGTCGVIVQKNKSNFIWRVNVPVPFLVPFLTSLVSRMALTTRRSGGGPGIRFSLPAAAARPPDELELDGRADLAIISRLASRASAERPGQEALALAAPAASSPITTRRTWLQGAQARPHPRHPHCDYAGALLRRPCS